MVQIIYYGKGVEVWMMDHSSGTTPDETSPIESTVIRRRFAVNTQGLNLDVELGHPSENHHCT